MTDRVADGAVQMEIGGLKCDTIGCDHTEPSVTFAEFIDWIDRPCPQCGAPLLTRADYDLSLSLVATVRGFNTAFDATGIPIPADAERVSIRLGGDGTGALHITVPPADAA